MLTVGDVERQIAEVEGFRARFVRPDGTDMRSDFAPAGLRPYAYNRAAPGKWTVAKWEATRFAHLYPGFKVQFRTSGNLPLTRRSTLLRNFRDM